MPPRDLVVYTHKKKERKLYFFFFFLFFFCVWWASESQNSSSMLLSRALNVFFFFLSSLTLSLGVVWTPESQIHPCPSHERQRKFLFEDICLLRSLTPSLGVRWALNLKLLLWPTWSQEDINTLVDISVFHWFQKTIKRRHLFFIYSFFLFLLGLRVALPIKRNPQEF